MKKIEDTLLEHYTANHLLENRELIDITLKASKINFYQKLLKKLNLITKSKMTICNYKDEVQEKINRLKQGKNTR